MNPRSHAVRPGGGKGANEFDSIDREDELLNVKKSLQCYPDSGPPSRRQLAMEHAAANAPGQQEARRMRSHSRDRKALGGINKVSPTNISTEDTTSIHERKCTSCGSNSADTSSNRNKCTTCAKKRRLESRQLYRSSYCSLS